MFGLQSDREMYMNEVEMLKKLGHSNVISLIETIDDDIGTSLVFPFIESNLSSEIYGESYSYTRERTQAVRQMLLAGVKHMHSLQVIHRDLKPSNILVDGHGVIRICDFGISLHARFHQFGICGTRAYMAPEIHLKIGYDDKVDIWVIDFFHYFQILHYKHTSWYFY